MNGVRTYNILKSDWNLLILEKYPPIVQYGQQGYQQQSYQQPHQYGNQPTYDRQSQQHIVVSIHEHQMTRSITSKKELINCVYVFVYSLIKREGFNP